MIAIVFDAPSDLEERVREVVSDEEVVRTRRDEPDYHDVLGSATIVAGLPRPEDLDRAERLEWLQLSSAGADRYAGRLGAGVKLTNASGVYGVPTSEHAIALMLAMVRCVPQSVRAAEIREWSRDGHYDELSGRTCGILGLGDIGSAIARRVRAFGMRVVATRRTPGHPPEFVDAVHTGADGLGEVLAASDHVVNVLPATAATRHLIDADAFGQMKPTAYFYNVGRGSTVDERALVEALRSGQIAGAGLDVFEDEPLPADSPLWGMPNVLITPHRGGASPREGERVADLFVDNLRRWTSGRELRNVVDPDLGY